MISACGLNCIECDLYKLPNDKKIQDKMIAFFRKQTWLNENEGIKTILEKGMYCKGCNVDKRAFWSNGCEIALCCKETKGLMNCSMCSDFSCSMLEDHAKQGEKYQIGVELLKSINMN